MKILESRIFDGVEVILWAGDAYFMISLGEAHERDPAAAHLLDDALEEQQARNLFWDAVAWVGDNEQVFHDPDFNPDVTNVWDFIAESYQKSSLSGYRQEKEDLEAASMMEMKALPVFGMF